MSLEQDVENGTRAEQLMSDLSPYFDIVEVAILEKWKTSPVADVEGQHELRLMIKLLDDLKGNIKTVIDTGKLAKVQIEQENLLTKAKKRFL